MSLCDKQTTDNVLYAKYFNTTDYNNFTAGLKKATAIKMSKSVIIE